MSCGPADEVVALYNRYARAWAERRGGQLMERAWLDRFIGLLPPNPHVLDLGCGSGNPIGRYLVGAGARLIGVDASPAMIGLAHEMGPEATWIVSDMRDLDIQDQVDGVIAWDSLFHLTQEDQRHMFPLFQRVLRENGALLFTSGPNAGSQIGDLEGDDLFHASLDPCEYRGLLTRSGFDIVSHVSEDPACGLHTVWLARRRNPDGKP